MDSTNNYGRGTSLEDFLERIAENVITRDAAVKDDLENQLAEAKADYNEKIDQNWQDTKDLTAKTRKEVEAEMSDADDAINERIDLEIIDRNEAIEAFRKGFNTIINNKEKQLYNAIAANEANFVGSFTSFKDLTEKSPTIVIGNNDYCVVLDASDYAGKTTESGKAEGNLNGVWRFKYQGFYSKAGTAGWIPEYQVSEKPLSAEDWTVLNLTLATHPKDNDGAIEREADGIITAEMLANWNGSIGKKPSLVSCTYDEINEKLEKIVINGEATYFGKTEWPITVTEEDVVIHKRSETKREEGDKVLETTTTENEGTEIISGIKKVKLVGKQGTEVSFISKVIDGKISVGTSVEEVNGISTDSVSLYKLGNANQVEYNITQLGEVNVGTWNAKLGQVKNSNGYVGARNDVLTIGGDASVFFKSANRTMYMEQFKAVDSDSFFAWDGSVRESSGPLTYPLRKLGNVIEGTWSAGGVETGSITSKVELTAEETFNLNAGKITVGDVEYVLSKDDDSVITDWTYLG